MPPKKDPVDDALEALEALELHTKTHTITPEQEAALQKYVPVLTRTVVRSLKLDKPAKFIIGPRPAIFDGKWVPPGTVVETDMPGRSWTPFDSATMEVDKNGQVVALT